MKQIHPAYTLAYGMARRAGLPTYEAHACGLRAAEAEKMDMVAMYRAANVNILGWFYFW